jgi:hypothetical protein
MDVTIVYFRREYALLRGGMEVAATFNLFVTHVSKEHGLVKIYGQTDVSTGTRG